MVMIRIASAQVRRSCVKSPQKGPKFHAMTSGKVCFGRPRPAYFVVPPCSVRRQAASRHQNSRLTTEESGIRATCPAHPATALEICASQGTAPKEASKKDSRLSTLAWYSASVSLSLRYLHRMYLHIKRMVEATLVFAAVLMPQIAAPNIIVRPTVLYSRCTRKR